MSDEKEQKKAKRLVHEYRFDKDTPCSIGASSQEAALDMKLYVKSVDDILDGH